jgi:hypothetical protein
MLFIIWIVIFFGLGYFFHKYQSWVIIKIKNIKIGKD